MRRLHLLRHGETEENASGIVMGQQPGVLSATGKKQAGASAVLLDNLDFDAVFVSTSARCGDTWAIINDTLQFQGPVTLLDELQERSFGEWEGKPKPTLEQWRSLGGDFLNSAPAGGETINQLLQRAARATQKIWEHDFENALVISHAGFINCLVALATNGPLDKTLFTTTLGNASLLHLDLPQALQFDF